MPFSSHTDLAYERHRASGDLEGCRYKEEPLGLCRLHTLHVDTEACGAALGCTVGCYRTLFFPPVTTLGEDETEQIAATLAVLLRQAETPQPKRILAVGLGNRAVTVDALGPQAAGGIHATAHLKGTAPDLFSALHCAEIAVSAPDVTANSGLETAPLVSAIAQFFAPDLVIAIDALAAHGLERLGTTVQISNASITPGAGTRSGGLPLCGEDLPCPILSIGAPTVCTPATLLREASEGLPAEALERLQKETEGFFLSPQDADTATERLAKIIATAINHAFGVPHL